MQGFPPLPYCTELSPLLLSAAIIASREGEHIRLKPGINAQLSESTLHERCYLRKFCRARTEGDERWRWQVSKHSSPEMQGNKVTAPHSHPLDQQVTHCLYGMSELQGMVVDPASQLLQIRVQFVGESVVELRELDNLETKGNERTALMMLAVKQISPSPHQRGQAVGGDSAFESMKKLTLCWVQSRAHDWASYVPRSWQLVERWPLWHIFPLSRGAGALPYFLHAPGDSIHQELSFFIWEEPRNNRNRLQWHGQK